MVRPSAAVPRATIVTRWTGSRFSQKWATRAWPISCAATRRVHDHLAVEPARAHQRRVQDVRTVGRGHDDDALRGVEAIHLDEELVERLLTLVVRPEPGAHHAGAPLADGVDLIEEHQRGRLLLRLLEQLPNPG